VQQSNGRATCAITTKLLLVSALSGSKGSRRFRARCAGLKHEMPKTA
jgi:hypothetical protein